MFMAFWRPLIMSKIVDWTLYKILKKNMIRGPIHNNRKFGGYYSSCFKNNGRKEKKMQSKL